MSKKFDNLLSTADVAAIFSTADSLIRASRSSGMLYGHPAPEHIKIGKNAWYKPVVITTWIDSFQSKRITTDPEPKHLQKAKSKKKPKK